MNSEEPVQPGQQVPQQPPRSVGQQSGLNKPIILLIAGAVLIGLMTIVYLVLPPKEQVTQVDAKKQSEQKSNNSTEKKDVVVSPTPTVIPSDPAVVIEDIDTALQELSSTAADISDLSDEALGL